MSIKYLFLVMMMSVCVMLHAEEINGVGEINDNHVRLRSDGNISATIITKMMKGQKVEIIGYNHNFTYENGKIYFWVNIIVDDYEGWVYSEYLTTDLYFPIFSSDIDVFKGSAMPSWDIELFCINDSTILYDSTFKPELKLRKTESVILDHGYYSTKEIKILFYIHSNEIIYFLPVTKSGKIYFVNISDVTPWYYIEKDKITYVAYSFSFFVATIDIIVGGVEKQESIYCLLPINNIIQENGKDKNTIYESISSANSSYVTIEQIKSFGLYNEIFIINRSITSAPYEQCGVYTEDILIMVLERNKLIEKKLIRSEYY